MVRMLFLTHGLNDKRIETLANDDSFVRIIRDVAAKQGEITVAYCQDGFSQAWLNDSVVPQELIFPNIGKDW